MGISIIIIMFALEGAPWFGPELATKKKEPGTLVVQFEEQSHCTLRLDDMELEQSSEQHIKIRLIPMPPNGERELRWKVKYDRLHIRLRDSKGKNSTYPPTDRNHPLFHHWTRIADSEIIVVLQENKRIRVTSLPKWLAEPIEGADIDLQPLLAWALSKQKIESFSSTIICPFDGQAKKGASIEKQGRSPPSVFGAFQYSTKFAVQHSGSGTLAVTITPELRYVPPQDKASIFSATLVGSPVLEKASGRATFDSRTLVANTFENEIVGKGHWKIEIGAEKGDLRVRLQQKTIVRRDN